MDTGAMAEEIRDGAGRDFADPQDVHDTLTGMHQLLEAQQYFFAQMAEKLAETGVHPLYSQAAQEAAAHLNGIADELEKVTAGGVMQGPG